MQRYVNSVFLMDLFTLSQIEEEKEEKGEEEAEVGAFDLSNKHFSLSVLIVVKLPVQVVDIQVL